MTVNLDRFASAFYYAPIPVLSLDPNGLVADYNIALETLFGDQLNGYRNLPLDGLAQRLASRVMTGELMPEFRAGAPKTECTFRVPSIGDVYLTSAEAVCHDPTTGMTLGRLIFWEVGPPFDVPFHEQYRKTLDHQLTWDTYAYSYDLILPLMPYYQEVLDRHTVALTAARDGPLVDIGAGTGNLVERLVAAGRRVTAVDNSRAMLSRLRAKPRLASEIGNRLTVIEANAESLPMFHDGEFTGVSILLALFDMRAPVQGLDTAIRLLRAGGRIVVTELKRDFRLDPILKECKAQLCRLGRYEQLEADLERVVRSNNELAPGSQSTFRAEDVLDTLAARDFVRLSMQDSHFGQCATVTGQKWGTGAS